MDAQTLPRFAPLTLRRLREPFDHSDWLFELKWDGVYALAHVRRDGADLISRNSNQFSEFAALADPVAWQQLLTQLRAKRWYVYAKAPFAGPKQVLTYLARYTHRIAISNDTRRSR